MQIVIIVVHALFLSTLSLRRATWPGLLARPFFIISIHALLAESDPGKVRVVEPGLVFLSTLSLRRATWILGEDNNNFKISIHALLAESDVGKVKYCCSTRDFYPRSPCGERRRSDCLYPWRRIFLSTLSLRRATEYWVGGYGTANNFYPRSPCGERRIRAYQRHFPPDISIHALLAESDVFFAATVTQQPRDFYPRSPCGERPQFPY